MNFKYKTYDTSSGYGNPEQWKAFFDGLFGSIFGGADFNEEEFKKQFREKYGKTTKETKKSSKSQGYFSDCNTKEEVKSKFRKLMMEYHPDKAGEQSTEKCKEIITAYELKLKKLK